MLTILSSFFGLASQDVWSGWYDAQAWTVALLVTLTVSVVCCLVFYYAVSRIKALTNGHYFLTMLCAALISGVASYGLAYWLIGKYAEDNMLESIIPGITNTLSSGTVDMILYSIIVFAIGLLMFFLVSLILKNWSPYYNIPFGKKHRQPKKMN